MNIKSQSVFVELMNYSPLKGEELKFVGWVMGLSLGQAPTGIGDDGISPNITGLVEDIPQARPACFSVQLEGPGKVTLGQNRHCGT